MAEERVRFNYLLILCPPFRDQHWPPQQHFLSVLSAGSVPPSQAQALSMQKDSSRMVDSGAAMIEGSAIDAREVDAAADLATTNSASG